MATLTVRAATRRDRIRLRHVRQREAWLSPPWDESAVRSGRAATKGQMFRIADAMFSSDVHVAAVGGEICGYALYDRGDDRWRWNLLRLGAGSPRVDATDEVAVELWVALLEEGIRSAGRDGARRIFAYSAAETAEYEALLAAGFAPYARFDVLRGEFRRGLRESVPIREQDDSDLWSIHQLYNRITPRAVQFAEALTSDAWTVDPDSRNPLRRPGRLGFVVPTEDGVGAVCQIELDHACPVVTVLCDDQLLPVMCSIIADALDHASIQGEVDVVIPEYQLDRSSLLMTAGFIRREQAVGLVRHTAATASMKRVRAEIVKLSEARAAVSVPYRTL